MVEAVLNQKFNLPDETKQLLSRTIPQKREPHYHIENPGILQQTDTIAFPNYNNYNQLLLVIDINNRMCDGRPLISPPKGSIKDSVLIDSFERIYHPENLPDNDVFINNYRVDEDGMNIPWLEKPKILQGDNHFGGQEFINWCNQNDINVKLTVPYRHNQNAYIEGINSWFRRKVNQYLLGKSISTGKKYTNWIECVGMLIKTRNQYIIDGLKGSDVRNVRIPGYVRTNPKTSYLIENGTRIRIHLDSPHDFIKGRHTNNPHTRIINRWSNNIYEIVESVLIPGNPPLYYVKREGTDENGKKFKKLNALYPAEQLLILPFEQQNV